MLSACVELCISENPLLKHFQVGLLFSEVEACIQGSPAGVPEHPHVHMWLFVVQLIACQHLQVAAIVQVCRFRPRNVHNTAALQRLPWPLSERLVAF